MISVTAAAVADPGQAGETAPVLAAALGMDPVVDRHIAAVLDSRLGSGRAFHPATHPALALRFPASSSVPASAVRLALSGQALVGLILTPLGVNRLSVRLFPIGGAQ